MTIGDADNVKAQLLCEDRHARAVWSHLARRYDLLADVAPLLDRAPVGAAGWLLDALIVALNLRSDLYDVNAVTDPQVRLVIPADPDWPTGLADLGDLGLRGTAITDDHAHVWEAATALADRITRTRPGRDTADPMNITTLAMDQPSRGPADPMDITALAAPPGVWVRADAGVDLPDLLDRAVVITGARASDAYGELVASTLAAGLAEHGWTVVTGGAFGVDATALRSALAAGGRAVIVQPGGVDRAYPAALAPLVDQVVFNGGAVVSEQPPGYPPTRLDFPRRTRLLAALTCAVVLVQCGVKSGAMPTCRCARALGRVVMAVPGPVHSNLSAGPHRLLATGQARLVETVDDVLAGLAGDAA